MSENTKMYFKPNGSIHVTGTVDFVDAQGKVIRTETDFKLCRCGHSKNQPFCDSSHKEHNWEAPALS
ncbi:MAG TPA: CDGSH iron-sulfur domain-containing protein [Candidatus Paceibacterota bacterium]|nr:CDGSH iron-sulfur domain-containing protein [Candidatus Paceibacterota bacterium]